MAPVADTNVFVRGRNQPFNEAITVPEVMEEIESERGKRNFDIVSVDVREPSETAMDQVRTKSDSINSPTSDVDEKLLALALDESEVLITDDKALQNLAMHLGVEFESYMADEVSEKRIWRMVCENCRNKVEGDKCPQCGSTALVRKPG
jgi:UPF0271 protein